jgi:hypothetical protein
MCNAEIALISALHSQLQHIQWAWSFRDVLAIANLVLLGATFNSISMMGNEPLFTVSFAAGVALKMFLGECMPPSMAKQMNNLLSQGISHTNMPLTVNMRTLSTSTFSPPSKLPSKLCF